MKKSFLKHFIQFLIIYTIIRCLLEVVIGGDLSRLLTLSHMAGTLLTSAFMAATIPYLTKKD